MKPGNIHFEDKNKSSAAVTQTQFPLTLSYACAVHKVQRIRLSKAVAVSCLKQQ